MTRAALRFGFVAVGLAFSIACGGPAYTTAPSPPAAAPLPPVISPGPPQESFPPLSAPARVFVVHRGVTSPVSFWTQESRYVLYNDGAFELQYVRNGIFPGRYTESRGVVRFAWTSGDWEATGTLEGNALTVRYNAVMLMSDFEDAVYVRHE